MIIQWMMWAAAVLLMTSPVSMETTEGLVDGDDGEFMVVTEGMTDPSDVTTEEYGSGSGYGEDTTTTDGSTSMRPTVTFSNTDTNMSTDTTTVANNVMTSKDNSATTSSNTESDVTNGRTASMSVTEQTVNSTTLSTLGSTSADDVTTVLGSISSSGESGGSDSSTMSSGVAPVAVITAAQSTVPACISSFDLSGRHSNSDRSIIVGYAWTVTSDVGTTQLSQTLDTFNAEDDGRGSPDVTVSGSDLGSASALYMFTLTVTDENDLQGMTTLDLLVSDESFTVSISSRIDTTAVDRTKGFQLRALAHFVEGCEQSSGVQFSWLTSMPAITLLLGITSNSVLDVPADTLSAGLSITFTIQACLTSDDTVCASASLPLSTSVNDLEAIIKGPSRRLVSVGSGDLSLDGSSSRDPAELPDNLTYSWSCESITLSESASSSAILTLSTDTLQPGMTYECMLTVTKGARSAIARTTIETTELETITVNLEVQSGATAVHADAITEAKCYFNSTVDVTVTWSMVSSDGSENIPLDDSTLIVQVQTQISIAGLSVSVITLRGDVLDPGGSYVVSCSLTNQNQQDVGQSSVGITVYNKPTGCSFEVSNYTALTEITLVTSGCSTTSVHPPLLYAYYYVINGDGDRNQLSLPTTEPSAVVIGPDAPDVTNSISFVVQVCDQYGSCSDFSHTAYVQPITMITTSEFTSFAQTHVTEVASSGDSFRALQNLNAIVAVTRDTSSDSAFDDAAVAERQIGLLSSALSENEGDSSAVKNVVDQLGTISTTDLASEGKGTLADVIDDVLSSTVADGSDSLGVPSLRTILETTQQLHSQGVGTSKVSEIEQKALKLLTKNARTGGGPVQITTPDATYTALNTVPCGSIDLKESRASMDMGDEICERLSSWDCGDESACLGVSVRSVVYEEGVDYITTSDSSDVLASGVLKVEFGSADTGADIVVSGLTEKVTLSIKVPSGISDSKAYSCKYWDESTKSWSTEGVTTSVDVSTGNVNCQTNHFSAFVVTSEEMTTTAEIGVVSPTGDAQPTEVPTGSSALRTVMLVLLGLFVFAMLVLFIVLGVIFLLKNKRKKVFKEDNQIILKEMRTRREERSRSNTPRGKVSPRPSPADGEEEEDTPNVPPNYAMEDPKIAWIPKE